MNQVCIRTTWKPVRNLVSPTPSTDSDSGGAKNLHLTNSSGDCDDGGVLRDLGIVQFLVQQVWSGACDFPFLTSTHVISMPRMLWLGGPWGVAEV